MQSFVLELWRDLPSLFTVAGDLDISKGKVDCLEADRLEFYYRIAAQVQRNRVSKLWKLSRSWYACAVLNTVDTPI